MKKYKLAKKNNSRIKEGFSFNKKKLQVFSSLKNLLQKKFYCVIKYWRENKKNKIKHSYAYSIIFLTAIFCFLSFFYSLNLYSVNYAVLLPSIRSFQSDFEPVNSCEFERIIDGVCVDSANLSSVDYAGVIIENSLDARPVSGLSGASLVIEMLVESSITRFLAFYPLDASVKKIGPVRSTRPYFLDWIKQFNALHGHVGGSPDALDLIRRFEISDLDEYSNSTLYWRSKDRFAPHNTYTSSELLRLGYDKKSSLRRNVYKNSDRWLYKDGASLADRGVDKKIVQVEYSIDDYNVSWKYDRESNRYTRYQGASAYLLSDDENVSADSILIMLADHEVIDSVGRKKINLINESGEAWLLVDGNYKGIRWNRKSDEDIFVFYEKNSDHEVALNRGKIWVHVVPIPFVVN